VCVCDYPVVEWKSIMKIVHSFNFDENDPSRKFNQQVHISMSYYEKKSKICWSYNKGVVK
jgi:hypothetical protein